MELLKLFNPFAKTSKPMEDHTLYQITTNSHNYCGCIVHQNEVMIKPKQRRQAGENFKREY